MVFPPFLIYQAPRISVLILVSDHLLNQEKKNTSEMIIYIFLRYFVILNANNELIILELVNSVGKI